jgi:pimeloyl-[acyl-carrier protein] synthase
MDKDVLNKGVFFALQEPSHVTNPYPLFRALRSEAPFYWDFVLGGWFLTGYNDVRAALADPRLTTTSSPFDVSQLPPDLQRDLAPFGRVMERVVLYTDTADHERLRRPLNRAFHPAAFERRRSEMETLADELLAKAERRGSMDVVSDYSRPIADYMMGELLGLPDDHHAELIACCDRLKNFTMARRVSHDTVVKAKAAVKSFQAVRAYFRRMIAARRENFADDVIGRSFAVEPNEAPPTEDDVLANCVLFLHTGVLNMSASITNAVVTLLQHPKQFARLRADPQSITTATEELLRYETPIQVALRGVPEEIEFAGRRIGPEQLLVLLLGAANRDPKQFAEPDRLDLTRRPNHHLSFGAGPHGCVGSWMARFGLTIALGAILDRQTEFRFRSRKLPWEFPAIWRTVRALPVLVDGRVRTRHKSRLSTTRALSPSRIRVAQTPAPSLP